MCSEANTEKCIGQAERNNPKEARIRDYCKSKKTSEPPIVGLNTHNAQVLISRNTRFLCFLMCKMCNHAHGYKVTLWVRDYLSTLLHVLYVACSISVYVFLQIYIYRLWPSQAELEGRRHRSVRYKTGLSESRLLPQPSLPSHLRSPHHHLLQGPRQRVPLYMSSRGSNYQSLVQALHSHSLLHFSQSSSRHRVIRAPHYVCSTLMQTFSGDCLFSTLGPLWKLEPKSCLTT